MTTFQWDGSDVTSLIEGTDIYETEYCKKKYWVIHFDNNSSNTTNTSDSDNNQTGNIEVCIMRTTKNPNLSCLIDELKPIFGLPKLGTHRCKQGGKDRILIRCPIKNNQIQDEMTLNMLENPSGIMKLQVQEIFAFRELLGVTCSYESSILIRKGTNNTYPISFYEPGMKTTNDKTTPFNVLDKWFEDTSIDEVVKRLLKIKSIDRMGVVLHDLRTKIENVIERVDRELIIYKTYIMDRITERLQTTLVDPSSSSSSSSSVKRIDI